MVAMGEKVAGELRRRNVAYAFKIPHPAARGKIRKPMVYCQVVRDAFRNWLSSQTAPGV